MLLVKSDVVAGEVGSLLIGQEIELAKDFKSLG
jgi:hypothetical protein